MKKLALNIEDLYVESFETASEVSQRGTVLANETTGNQIICECTEGVGTCHDTCAHTCRCGGGGGGNTNDATCATGNQIICEC